MINKFFEFILRLFSDIGYAAGPTPPIIPPINPPPEDPSTLCLSGVADPPKLYCLLGSLEKIMGYVFPAGGLIAVAMIIVGGYMWIMSGGDPARKQQAQATLTWSVIGLVLLVSIYILLKFVLSFVLP